MYKTVQGDTFDIVAKKVLGSELYMDRLIKANPAYQSFVIFPAGIELNVPVVDKASSLQNNNMFPPWKRGQK